jgi:hypothetical protein
MRRKILLIVVLAFLLCLLEFPSKLALYIDKNLHETGVGVLEFFR